MAKLHLRRYRRMVVLINVATASDAKQFTLRIRHLYNVTVAVQQNMGVIDYELAGASLESGCGAFVLQ